MLIGLAGKSCSGKNYIGELLAKRGMKVMDLDSIAHGILDSCAAEVASVFGPQLVVDGHVDRKALGAIVFADPGKRTVLESILYGRLGEEIRRTERSSDCDVVANGALLHRSGHDAWCSCLVYVDAPYEVRLARAKERDGIDEEAFARREASQSDVDYRENAYSCPVIAFDNAGRFVSEVDIDELLVRIESYRSEK